MLTPRNNFDTKLFHHYSLGRLTSINATSEILLSRAWVKDRKRPDVVTVSTRARVNSGTELCRIALSHMSRSGSHRSSSDSVLFPKDMVRLRCESFQPHASNPRRPDTTVSIARFIVDVELQLRQRDPSPRTQTTDAVPVAEVESMLP